jgi:DNA-binding PadR family transcriptional regulator
MDRPLELLEKHGYIKSRSEESQGTGRHPKPTYLVNPLWDRQT